MIIVTVTLKVTPSQARPSDHDVKIAATTPPNREPWGKATRMCCCATLIKSIEYLLAVIRSLQPSRVNAPQQHEGEMHEMGRPAVASARGALQRTSKVLRSTMRTTMCSSAGHNHRYRSAIAGTTHGLGLLSAADQPEHL
jgi:hypothetical protein